jgi:uncharacterized protein YdgA (DUF945 family)
MSTKRTSPLEIIIWLISILIIVVVASPFVLGFKIKDDYNNMINRFSHMMQVDMRISNYDRGFFSSAAVLEVLIPGTGVVLEFKENIVHGPLYLGLINQNKSPFVVAVANGEMLPVKGFESIFDQAFAGKAPVMYQNVIDFSGNLDIIEYVPPVNAVIEFDTGAVKINSSGMTVKSYYSAFEDKISGEGVVSSFDLSADDTKVDLKNVNFSYSGRMGQNDLLMGDSVLSFDKLEVNSESDQFVLNKFNASSMTTEAGVLINSQTRLNAREIYASNQRIGPVTFNIVIDGLNANAIKQIQAMQEEIEIKAQQGVPEEQINAMLAGQMIAIVPDLFKQTSLKIDPLSLESELGKLDAHMDFSVEGLDDTTPADPLFMLSAINLETDFNVDEALMRQLIKWQLPSNDMKDTTTKQSIEQRVTDNLKDLLNESWLTFIDGKYKSKISLQQGQMLMNGKAVDPMEQIMSQMAPSPVQ